MNRTYQVVMGAAAAALLAMPALAQAPRPLPMNDCSPAKYTPAGIVSCQEDNKLRVECNKVSNPAQCYQNAKAGKPVAKPAAPAPAPAAKPAAPAAPKIAASVPQGFAVCADENQRCNATGNWTGYYGANGKFAPISGSGAFSCTTSFLRLSDPAPGVVKKCYVIASAVPKQAPQQAAKAAAPAKPAVAALPLSCSGGLVNNKTVKLAGMGDLQKLYTSGDSTTATTLAAATDECKARCARTGEPAPCGWYTLVQWRADTSADGKSRTAFTCYLKNDRSYKNATKPVLANDKNFGTPSNGLFYRDAWTYPCAR
jgi:hypothetical protein